MEVAWQVPQSFATWGCQGQRPSALQKITSTETPPTRRVPRAQPRQSHRPKGTRQIGHDGRDDQQRQVEGGWYDEVGMAALAEVEPTTSLL